jgi:hypothetical protein
MKRGFLLRAEERKAAAKRRCAQKPTDSEPLASPTAAQPDPQHFKGEGQTGYVYYPDCGSYPYQILGFGVDKNGHLLGKLAHGNLTEQEKGPYDAIISPTSPINCFYL